MSPSISSVVIGYFCTYHTRKLHSNCTDTVVIIDKDALLRNSSEVFLVLLSAILWHKEVVLNMIFCKYEAEVRTL